MTTEVICVDTSTYAYIVVMLYNIRLILKVLRSTSRQPQDCFTNGIGLQRKEAVPTSYKELPSRWSSLQFVSQVKYSPYLPPFLSSSLSSEAREQNALRFGGFAAAFEAAGGFAAGVVRSIR